MRGWNECAWGRVVHVVAGLLIFAALANGIAVTGSQEWPVGPDTLRDIASAETIRATIGRTLKRGVALPDPYYKNEVFWYSPLMPSLLAAGAMLTDAPVHIVATRAPVYWNLCAPIAFYLLAVVLFDPLIALVALAIFLYVEPFPAREAATYSPALIASSLAQTFFYLALLAWTWFRRTLRVGPALAAGCLLGVSFLAHATPTALLAVIFVADTVAWLYQARRSHERLTIAARCALAAAVGLIVASPGLVALVHYHMRIRELEPFVYLDPSMGPEHVVDFLRANVSAHVFTGAAGVGLVVLVARSASPSRRTLATWCAASVGLFAWAAYAVRLAPWEGIARLAIAPAHHFLIYVRAAESLLAGVGALALIRLAAVRAKPALEAPLAFLATAVLVGVSLPSYGARDAPMVAATFSENQRSAIEWIESRSAPGSVFLAPENTGVSMIGLVGRKTVIVERVFSNPYVDWSSRDAERQAMWTSLASNDCAEFVKHADPFDVTHLLLVDGMTPPIPDGACGFVKLFDRPPFAIFSRVSGEAVRP